MERPMSPAGRRKFGLLFSGFAGIFLVVGAGMAWHQGHRLAVSRPVPATIGSTRVDTVQGSDGPTYKPVVEFSYRVDGRDYRGDDPLPMAVSTSSYADTLAVTALFRTGQEVTAWYDPAHPESAFLIKQPSFFPYIFILFPMIHCAVGLAMMLFSGADPRARAPRMAILAALWCGVGLAAGGHFAVIGGVWTVLPTVALAVYGAVGAGFIAAWRLMAAKAARSADPVEPARGFVDEPNPFRHA